MKTLKQIGEIARMMILTPHALVILFIVICFIYG